MVRGVPVPGRKSALEAEARTLGLLLGRGAAIKLHARDGLAGEDVYEADVLGAESVGLNGEYGKCAQDADAGAEQGHAEIRTAGKGVFEIDTLFTKARVGGSIAQQERRSNVGRRLVAVG